MKKAKACLKCGHDHIWRIDPVSYPDPEYSNAILPLPVASQVVENPDAGLLQSPTKRVNVGTFVAYVCASCGYSEIYARDIQGLAKLGKGHAGSRVTRTGAKKAAAPRD